MNALGDILWNAANAFSCAWQVLRYLGGFLCLLLLPHAGSPHASPPVFACTPLRW
jgi:hypothetical protein